MLVSFLHTGFLLKLVYHQSYLIVLNHIISILTLINAFHSSISYQIPRKWTQFSTHHYDAESQDCLTGRRRIGLVRPPPTTCWVIAQKSTHTSTVPDWILTLEAPPAFESKWISEAGVFGGGTIKICRSMPKYPQFEAKTPTQRHPLLPMMLGTSPPASSGKKGQNSQSRHVPRCMWEWLLRRPKHNGHTAILSFWYRRERCLECRAPFRLKQNIRTA